MKRLNQGYEFVTEDRTRVRMVDLCEECVPGLFGGAEKLFRVRQI